MTSFLSLYFVLSDLRSRAPSGTLEDFALGALRSRARPSGTLEDLGGFALGALRSRARPSGTLEDLGDFVLGTFNSLSVGNMSVAFTT